MTDPIAETDLHGYVDDQLDIARRLEVQDYLAHHPDIAARVMADLKMRDGLWLTSSVPSRASDRVLDQARRLETGWAAAAPCRGNRRPHRAWLARARQGRLVRDQPQRGGA